MEQAEVFYFQNLVFMAHIAFSSWGFTLKPQYMESKNKYSKDKHSIISGLAFLFSFFPDAPVTPIQSKSKLKTRVMKDITDSGSLFVLNGIPDGTSEWSTLFKILFWCTNTHYKTKPKLVLGL